MKVYNSLTFKKEEFKSIVPNEVKIYVCGPTVYDSVHIGHAKSAMAFDIIHRYLKYKGYNIIILNNSDEVLGLWLDAKGITVDFSVHPGKCEEIGWHTHCSYRHIGANNVITIGGVGYKPSKWRGIE